MGKFRKNTMFLHSRFFDFSTSPGSDVLINEEREFKKRGNVGRREGGKGKRNRSSIASRDSGSWRSTIAFHEIWNFYRL